MYDKMDTEQKLFNNKQISCLFKYKSNVSSTKHLKTIAEQKKEEQL